MEEDKRLRQSESISRKESDRNLPLKSSLEQARILRLAERLHLSTESVERVKAKLFGAQGLDISAIESRHSMREVPHNDDLLASGSALKENYRAKEAISPSPNFSQSAEVTEIVAPPKARAENIHKKEAPLEDELLLRKKIEAAPYFSSFKADAWKLYEKYPRPDVGGRLIELALLYGSAHELAGVLNELGQSSPETYLGLDDASRIQILFKLWLAERLVELDNFYFRKDVILKLNSVEKWFVAWAFVRQGKPEQLYRWWKRNEHEISTSQKMYGGNLAKSSTELLLELGAAAFRMHDEEAAVLLLEKIPSEAPEYHQAVDLLLNVRIERNEQGLSTYEFRLNRELDWKSRLGLFDSFFQRLQKYGHSAPKDRAAFNALLKDPLKWFPETPEAWHLVSEMILQYSGLERLLPNLMNHFFDNALVFQRPAMDHAIWAPMLDHDFRDPIKTLFWRSIALLHEFAMQSGEDEQKLWESKRCYDEAQSYAGHNKALPIKWQDIHDALSQWIAKSERFDESRRKTLLMTSRLTADSKDITENDLHGFLGEVRTPELPILLRIEELAIERKHTKLEGLVLVKKAARLHFTNRNLAKLLHFALDEGKIDKAWRICSLLHVRKILAPELDKAWAISGENRKEFPFHTLSDWHLNAIFSQFEGNERRLVEAVSTVGPLIPELLASLNPNLVPLKKTKAATKAETETAEYLEKLTWLSQGRKQFGSGSGGLWQLRPPMFTNLSDGRWSAMFVGLSQALGLNSWDWQLSLLNQHIERLIPKMTRSSEALQVGKVGRWLRGLSPLQRKSWYDLAHVSKKFEDDEAQMIISRFVAMLTTTVYQDHIGALSTLDKVRAPLRLRWDLEIWLASDAYSEVRKSLGSQMVTKFSENVFRMPVLIPESPRLKRPYETF